MSANGASVPSIRRGPRVRLPTRYGEFDAVAYVDLRTMAEHIAILAGDLHASEVLVRVHSECLTGDVLGSLRCDCGAQLETSMTTISSESGVLIYMGGQEGRGIGRFNKLAAYAMQEQGLDTVDANLQLGLPSDSRDYGAAAAILGDLGVTRIRLLTNNPAKVSGLSMHGVKVVERVPLQTAVGPDNAYYLKTKERRMGHHSISLDTSIRQ